MRNPEGGPPPLRQLRVYQRLARRMYLETEGTVAPQLGSWVRNGADLIEAILDLQKPLLRRQRQ